MLKGRALTATCILWVYFIFDDKRELTSHVVPHKFQSTADKGHCLCSQALWHKVPPAFWLAVLIMMPLMDDALAKYLTFL